MKRPGVKSYHYTPEELLLDIFPFVLNSASMKDGVTITAGMPVVLGESGLEPVTSATIDSVVGIAAEDTIDVPEEDPVIAYYETGGFHGDRLVLPEDVTREDIQPVLRKLSIFIR